MSATQFAAPVRHSEFYIDDKQPFVTLLVRHTNIPRQLRIGNRRGQVEEQLFRVHRCEFVADERSKPQCLIPPSFVLIGVGGIQNDVHDPSGAREYRRGSG